MPARWAKIVMCVALGLYATLVALDNVIDYGSNYAFVRHVLSMDTTLPGNRLTPRAITSPVLWRIAYLAIMLAEAATGLLFLVAAGALWRARRAEAVAFQHAKSWVYAAATAGFLVWFLGFMVVGGEWFAMWQSAHWNGDAPAFRPLLVILAVLIFVNQPDGEVDNRGRAELR